MDPVWRGVLNLVLVTAGLALAVGALLYAAEIGRMLSRIRRQRRPAPLMPAGPPLADLARDLRRLHCAYRHHPAGQPMARRRGIEQAYDDALLDACRALGVADSLSGLPPGTERDAERLRVEFLLEQHGLVLGLRQQ